jgi:hypothetical protein
MGLNYKVDKLGDLLVYTYSDDDVNGKYVYVTLKTGDITCSNVHMIKPVKYIKMSKTEQIKLVHKLVDLIIK